jgi:RNA polymerase sigma-70 factor (ECF subfamily)
MPDVPHDQTQSTRIQPLVERLMAGDMSARDELIEATCDRLLRLTRSIKHGYGAVGRWEQTEDVFQRAVMRLYQSLAEVPLVDARHFLRLAALQIRRELTDLARHYAGPQGMGAHYRTQLHPGGETTAAPPAYEGAAVTDDPVGLAQWNEFHQAIQQLPDEQRETVELLFYHGLGQQQAADLMGISVRTVKRHWREARLALHDLLDGRMPGT